MGVLFWFWKATLGHPNLSGNPRARITPLFTDPSAAFKLAKAEEVLDTISKRIHIAKVDSDDGLDAKGMLERETLKFSDKFGVMPSWVCLDWLGTMADVGGEAKSSSDRALASEYAANSCVKFADESTIPTLVLAQAVNDAQLKKVLTISDVGIAKGILGR